MSSDDTTGESDAPRALGAALRRHRMAKGMSLRALARHVGLTGHSTLVDYEHGRRILPEDLAVACEKALGVPDGELRRLRQAALRERATSEATALLQPPKPEASADGSPAGGRRWRRRWAYPVVLVLLVAVTAGFATYRMNSKPGATGTPPAEAARIDFERPGQRWSVLYGDNLTTAVSDRMAYQGTHSFVVTITAATAREGHSAVGTTHDLEGLRPGMPVTMYVWTHNPDAASMRFFVRNSASDPVWAPETPRPGAELPFPQAPGWSPVTWTVPQVDVVYAIGIEVYTKYDDPFQFFVDNVDW